MSGTRRPLILTWVEAERHKKPGVRPPVKLGVGQTTRPESMSPSAAQGYCQGPKKSIKLFQGFPFPSPKRLNHLNVLGEKSWSLWVSHSRYSI